jgi:hypothetical protein
MQILKVRQAYELAGVYRDDSEIERDIKFDQYFRNYRFRIADTVTHEILAECRQENLDFLITKD